MYRETSSLMKKTALVLGSPTQHLHPKSSGCVRKATAEPRCNTESGKGPSLLKVSPPLASLTTKIKRILRLSLLEQRKKKENAGGRFAYRCVQSEATLQMIVRQDCSPKSLESTTYSGRGRLRSAFGVHQPRKTVEKAGVLRCGLLMRPSLRLRRCTALQPYSSSQPIAGGKQRLCRIRTCRVWSHGRLDPAEN